MKEAILIIAVLGIFAYGYFLITKLDKFLDKNHKSVQKEIGKKKPEPTGVMLTDELSEEEIAEEIRRFKNQHSEIRIVLYSRTDTTITENTGDHPNRNQ